MVLASSIYIYIRVYVNSHSLGQLALVSKRAASSSKCHHYSQWHFLLRGSFMQRSLKLQMTNIDKRENK